MQKIEKYRKIFKVVQYIGMGLIAAAGMFAIYWFGFRGESNEDGYSMTFLMLTILVFFIYMVVGVMPMQAKLLKLIILESLNGLLSDVTFNKKKGYSKEAFVKLHYAPANFTQYGNTDYFAGTHNGQLIECVTAKAYDEVKVAKTDKKGKKKKGTKKDTIIHFLGKIYIFPFESTTKYNVIGKKHPSVTRRKEMIDTPYNKEVLLKFKKYYENFEVYYKDEKPENLNAVLEKLYTLKLQAKGPVSLYVRKNSCVLLIDNSRCYEEVDLKKPINPDLVKGYRRDVSMVITFINSLNKKD